MPVLEACPPSKPSSLSPAPLKTCHRFQFGISLTPTENSVRVLRHWGGAWGFCGSAPTAGEFLCSEMQRFPAAAVSPPSLCVAQEGKEPSALFGCGGCTSFPYNNAYMTDDIMIDLCSVCIW